MEDAWPWGARLQFPAGVASVRGMAEQREGETKAAVFYCPRCAREVIDPLTCGDCSAVICRACGTPLESSDELGIG